MRCPHQAGLTKDVPCTGTRPVKRGRGGGKLPSWLLSSCVSCLWLSVKVNVPGLLAPVAAGVRKHFSQ